MEKIFLWIFRNAWMSPGAHARNWTPVVFEERSWQDGDEEEGDSSLCAG